MSSTPLLVRVAYSGAAWDSQDQSRLRNSATDVSAKLLAPGTLLSSLVEFGDRPSGPFP